MNQETVKNPIAPMMVEKIASGQKMVITAISMQLIGIVLQFFVGDIVILLFIAAAITAWVGLFRLGSGLEYSTGAKIGYAILLLIPLIGLIVLLAINQRATQVLKNAGYRVGFFGARK